MAAFDSMVTANAIPEVDRTEDRLQLTLDCADMGIWAYDSASGVFSADARVMEMLGADQAEGDLAYWLAFVHEGDRTRVLSHFQEPWQAIIVTSWNTGLHTGTAGSGQGGRGPLADSYPVRARRVSW